MYVRLGFLLIFLFGTFPAQAAMPTCAKENTKVSVHIIYEAPRVKKDADATLFTKKTGEGLKVMSEGIEGLPARVTFQPMLGVSAPITGYDKGCWVFGDAQVYLGAKDVFVLLPESVSDNACAVEELWKHETDHIAAHKQFLHALESKISTKVAQKLATPIPLRKTAQIDAQYELERTLAAGVKEAWEEANDSNQKVQASLDSVTETQRLKQACGGFIGQAFVKMSD